MASDRTQRRIDTLLDEAEQAISRLDWQVVGARAQAVLALDPGNRDATKFLAAAGRGLDASAPSAAVPDIPAEPVPASSTVEPTSPSAGLRTSFAGGHYQVTRELHKLLENLDVREKSQAMAHEAANEALVALKRLPFRPYGGI